MIDIKNLHTEGPGGQAELGQVELSVQKNEKITRTVPILKSILHNVHLIFFL